MPCRWLPFDNVRSHGNSRTPNLQPVSPFSKPESFGEDETELAGGEPAGAYKVVETIMGQKRTLTAVPRR